ncbi:MAG: hypothetical protein AB7F75_04580 [Planctomycetota bacterium]
MSINSQNPELCPVSGHKLGSMGEPVTVRHNSADIQLCCLGCVLKLPKESGIRHLLRRWFGAFLVTGTGLTTLPLQASPEARPEITQEAQEQDEYPLETCVVSGLKLGSMGDTVILKYKGVEVRFCCSGCPKAFLKDPEPYLRKIKDAK